MPTQEAAPRAVTPKAELSTQREEAGGGEGASMNATAV